ncbi:MAG: hypothetical protein U1F37_19070 [Alphaproteobacteria bacterium]
MECRLGSAGFRLLALAALAVVAVCGPAGAADGPPAGRYEIRSYTAIPDSPSTIYGTPSYMVLGANGSYELYDTKSNELRSRGTYAFESGTAGAPGSVGLVRWKSGINYEMGRGGSYFPSNAAFKCQHCIQLGSLVIAVLKR